MVSIQDTHTYSRSNDQLIQLSNFKADENLDISTAFSDFSAYSSDISGELHRLASFPTRISEPCSSFFEKQTFSTEITETISPQELHVTVKRCIDCLSSNSVAEKRSAAAKLRFLAKNRAENRAVIGESGAIPALVHVLKNSGDPLMQEQAVTAIFNLSLLEKNKSLISECGAEKGLIYVLKSGTEVSKENAACALLSLAMVEEKRLKIGAMGAIGPLVNLVINGSDRGKKDALTTLYKLCSVRLNKERAVRAGAVKALVGLVGEGLAEKAMVVLSSLAGCEIGKVAIVEEGGIGALVEVVEDGSGKGKEFAVFTLLLLCGESVRNRGLLVREGGIPPLVALSQNGTPKAKHKAETLLGYLREPRPETSSRSP